jgi:transposase
MRAYSEDLRRKIVDAIGRGMPKAEAARTFGVGISTVKRYATKARRGEPLEPAKAPGKRPKIDSGSASSSKETSRSVRSSP